MDILRITKSVCPNCLKTIPATLERDEKGRVFLCKTCAQHGSFRTLIWRGLLDFEAWRRGTEPLMADEGAQCPGECRNCSAHPQGTCCALLEVTRRCNLDCRFCFAHNGDADVPVDELRQAVDIILKSGHPLIQLSGGEPTLRDDLPELVSYIHDRGGRYVQINTNGIRLAEDEAYVSALADAGLNIVFLQFDGTDDEIYRKLRGRPLFDVKNRAIERCGHYGIGVTLVPTVVRGVNDRHIGEIVRFGAFLSPVVRGVHFQPVSYFGKYPTAPADDDRYTLDELIHALATQLNLDANCFSPSHCDHPACGLHASFVSDEFGELTPLSRCGHEDVPRRVSAGENCTYIGERWSASRYADAANAEPGSMDEFLYRVGHYGFTVTSMAFQDALNLDVERLRRCSLHVFEKGRLIPFCAKYLTRID